MNLRDSALRYAEAGIPVFSVHHPTEEGCSCGDEECESPGKHPATANGFKDATTDRDQIEQWWDEMPEANIGVPTGQRSGVGVLDVDGPEGEDELGALELEHSELPETIRAATGKGEHVYFALPDDCEIGNSVGELGEGLDVRADGGYVVVPPSQHASGRRYEWLDGSPADGEPAPLPDWLHRLLTSDTEERGDTPTRTGAVIPEGRRNNSLFKLGCSMRGRGASHEAIEAALLAENQRRCQPPLCEQEVLNIARSSSGYEPDEAASQPIERSSDTPLPIYRDDEIEDLPNAEWQVEELCLDNSLVAVYGPEGTYKTFYGLDLSFCIGTGRPFHGREVEQGKVVYVYAEGASGLNNRIRAWKQAHGRGVNEASDVWFVPTAVNLMDEDGIGLEELIETIRATAGESLGLIVIDTLARAFGDADEDATQAMNTFTNRCGQLRETFDCSVLVIHHTGWETKRERGNRSLRNNFDTVMKCESNGRNRLALKCDKQKDAPFFEDFQLRAREVELPEGETSLVLLGASDEVQRAPQVDDECRQLLEVLAEFDGKGATYSDWCDAVRRSAGVSKSTFKRRRDVLVERGFVTQPPAGDSKGFRYQLSDEGQSALRSEEKGGQEEVDPNGNRKRADGSTGSKEVPVEEYTFQRDRKGSRTGSDESITPSEPSGSGGGAYRAPPEPDTATEGAETETTASDLEGVSDE